MREFFPHLAGNETLRRRIGNEISQGSFSHAYIIEGPRGSGKKTFAREIAMAAACEHRSEEGYPLPCGTCRSCRKIREGICPDVIPVTRLEGKAGMGVEVVRGIRSSVAVVPNDLDLKIYIIEEAHTMTEEAQNALLLTLEEPPAFVMFLLLAEDANALLETVRSRAPIFRMQPVKEDVLRTHLLQNATAKALEKERPAEFAELLLLSGGCIGRALELLDSKMRAPLTDRRRFAAQAMELLAGGTKNDELLLLLRSRGQNREEITADLLAWEGALRDLVLLNRTEQAPLLFFTDREAAAELSARFTAARLFEILSAIDAAKGALAANANVRLTVTHLIERIITRSCQQKN